LVPDSTTPAIGRLRNHRAERKTRWDRSAKAVSPEPRRRQVEASGSAQMLLRPRWTTDPPPPCCLLFDDWTWQPRWQPRDPTPVDIGRRLANSVPGHRLSSHRSTRRGYLRIRRLGIRVPPSALNRSSSAAYSNGCLITHSRLREPPENQTVLRERAPMPTRPVGDPDGKGGWYLKVTVGSDHATGRREQLARRGFRTATEASVAGANWSPKSIAADSSPWREGRRSTSRLICISTDSTLTVVSRPRPASTGTWSTPTCVPIWGPSAFVVTAKVVPYWQQKPAHGTFFCFNSGSAQASPISALCMLPASKGRRVSTDRSRYEREDTAGTWRQRCSRAGDSHG